MRELISGSDNLHSGVKGLHVKWMNIFSFQSNSTLFDFSSKCIYLPIYTIIWLIKAILICMCYQNCGSVGIRRNVPMTHHFCVEINEMKCLIWVNWILLLSQSHEPYNLCAPQNYNHIAKNKMKQKQFGNLTTFMHTCEICNVFG